VTAPGTHEAGAEGEEEMGRRIAWIVSLATLLGLLAVAPAALAAGGEHTQTYTKHQHGTIVQKETNPCTGGKIYVTETVNAVEHVTYFPGEDEVWATFTTTGSASFTDGGVDYSGHFTAWGNFNVNEQNANSTFTFSIFLNGSDGSRITAHEVAHITYNGNGEITVEFDKLHLDGC
jgi:hypothetical protein